MAQFDKNGDAKRARSLLAMASPGSADAGHKAGGSLLKTPVADEPVDAAARHRLARSRREASKSPLMSALARQPEPHSSVEADPAPTGEEHEAGRRPVPAAQGLRAMLRDRLLGREAPRGEGSTSAAKPTVPTPEPTARPAYAARPAPARPSAPPAIELQARENEIPAHAATRVPRDPAAWRPLIDPIKVISGIANAKLLIVTMTAAGALLGVAVALSTPNKYESVAEMLVDPRDLRLTDREITTTGLPSDATLAIVENQVRVLTSGTVLNRVVDELNLTSDPEFNGEADGGLLSTLSNWRALFSRSGGDDGGARKRAMTIDNLGRSLSVERGGKTFVVSVGVTTESPDKSALIANTMTRVFLETYGKFQSDTAGRAADELTSRLDELRREVEEAERKVETFKAENDLIGSQGRLISEDEIVTLNTQLSVARARTLELNAKAASARAVNADTALTGALPEELTSNVMTELRSQYASLKSEADRLSARLGPRHPQRLAIDAQLEGARAQIETELRRIVGSIQTELRRAVQLEQELASRLAQLKVGQGTVNADLVTLRELEREATAKRAVYESFLLRAKETGEQRDINAANISVISQAFPPIVSVGPSRAVTVLTFMIAGFLGGVGIGGARGAWRSLRDDAEARQVRGETFDVGGTSPDPDGGPQNGPHGGRPVRTTPDETYARQESRERPAPPAPQPEFQPQAANEGDETMATRTSGWLDAFRRKIRQDEPAAPEAPTVPTQVPTYNQPLAPAHPLHQAPAAYNPYETFAAAQAPAGWQAAPAAPQSQTVSAWQMAAAPIPQAPMPAYGQGAPAWPQPTPAMSSPVAYPVHPAAHPQQPMPHAQVPVMQPVGYPQSAPQPMPAVAQPFPPAPAPAFTPPATAMPLYQPASQPYPYPVATHMPAPQAAPMAYSHAPAAYAAPVHVAPAYVTHVPHAPAHAAPSAEPVYARPAWRDEELAYRSRVEADRRHARSVDELREDLRDFREAVLDLAESRARRRYG